MPDATAPLQQPPSGTIVSEAALYNTQITLYRNTLAFGGMMNPTMIWASMQREDGLAIPYYREIEEKDTDVANALDTFKLSVLKRENKVVPADQTALAQDIAAFVQAQFDGLPDFHAVLSGLLDAPAYGFSIGEMIFDTSMGQASLLDVLDCPQELFLFNQRNTPQIGPLQFLTQVQASEGTLVPEEKFVVFTYRGRARNRMGRPLLRSVFWSSWFKRNVQRLWMRYAEKGPGTAVVRYPDAADPVQKLQAANLAQQIIELTAVGVPANFEIDRDLLKGARTIEVAAYEHLYEAMQLDVVRRILGETLTSFGSDKGKGTQALGNTHAETLDDKSVELAKSLAGSVNRQMVRRLVTWNYGPNAPMPAWLPDTSEAKDLTERLNIDKGLQGMGLEMPISYLQTTYGIPAPQNNEPVAKATPTAVAPLAPVTANFSEGPGREMADQQLAQFDTLVDELKSESLKMLSERTSQITDALQPAVQ
jgi:phage gp29-like protein